MLTADNLTKTYRRHAVQVRVLNGLNLEVKTGEFLSIVGASGSGKSTLLHLLGTLDAPDSGHIIARRQAHRQPARARARPAAEPHLRLHLPVLPPAARTQHARQRADAGVHRHSARWAGGSRDRSGERGPRNCCSRWAWRTASSTGRANFPAARCSAPRLLGRC